jgi:hypothetical protein
MKKTLLFCVPALLLATSCVDSLDDYNIDPKQAAVGTIPATSLVSNAQRRLGRNAASASVNSNPFRFYVQYWAATTYAQESRYDLTTRNISTNNWDVLYTDALRDLREARGIIAADPILDPKVKANQLACIEVLEVYGWATLVDTFGDVPYSEALDITKTQPKYDDDAAIYADLITRLNAAINAMQPASAGLGTADLMNGGSMPLWVKFANSLKLRLAMTIADVDATKAKTLAEDAVKGGLLASNADVIDITFSTTPNSNPLWEDLVNSGRTDFVGARPFINRLNKLKDPRITSYFKPVAAGQDSAGFYKGAIYGASNAYDPFSAPGTKLEAAALPSVIFSYAEVQFLLADAADRGWNVGGSVESFYNAGVTASITEWGGTAAQATTYLAQPEVKFATAIGADNREKIGNQEWIALYNQPIDAYREWRRLDSPKLTKGVGALSDIPVRLTYPSTEQNLNTASYNAAAAAIGGDKVTTRIFWDKK